MALTPRRLRPVQVSDDVASQQAALEPAFRTILAGLARDFAYVDGVGDALVNLRVAVQRMEASITAGEAALWRYAWRESLVLRQPSNASRNSKQRAEEVEAGRRAVSAMLNSLKGGTAVVQPSEDAQ